MTKFCTKFTLLDIKPPTRLRRVRTEENITAVSASVYDDPQISIRRRSQQLVLWYSTTWKIFRKDLGVKSFKLQLVHVSCFVSLSNIFSLVYNLAINRLTNEQRSQIIEFYYQNACSVGKVQRALLPLYAQFNRPTIRLFGLL